MGVPDFVKYIARSSPGALCRVAKGDSAAPLVFDFILVDATNAAQTLGLENLLAFLNPQHIVARTAIIFALDSQRDRTGTARSHRHALVRIGDLDVQLQKLCSQLVEVYRSYNSRHRTSGNGSERPLANPHVLSSGRGVAGEADYKLLDLQRSLLTCALAAGTAPLPSFLFVSEDSDVLCGALCGPAPQQVSIATRLQDVLYEPSILRLDRVLAFIATCTDAFYAENEREAAVAAATKAKAAAELSAAKAARQTTSTPQAASHTRGDQRDEEVELSVTDTAMAPKPKEDVVRRRKQDGPMVATGVRIELTDSSEEDEPEKEDEEQAPSTVELMASHAESQAKVVGAKASACSSVQKQGQSGETVAADPVPTEGELTVSTIAYTSSVDMVFLFMIVMGNAVSVPPLMRGATKVDAGSCWQAYCKQKYKNLSASEAETGRVLLTCAVSTHSTSKGSFILNCEFLHSILDAVHYADAEARPPGEEEKSRALAYLSGAVYSTLRYVVGCNLEKPPALQQTFLDSRPLSETAVTLPSLSAVMWVLSQEATRTFTFPLHGLAKKELLAVAAGESTGAKERAAVAVASVGELDVGEHLVAPVAANAWAVRGARSNNVSLATLAQDFTTTATATTTAGSVSGVALRAAQLPSMTELLKKCLQKVSPAVLAKANLLVYLIAVWEYALGMGVRRIAALTKGAVHVEETGAAVAPATQAAGHYVYSFELRRMAPVMQSSDTPAHQTATKSASTPDSASSAAPTAAASSSHATTSGGLSAAQQAVLMALGVSYDYSRAPQTPENLVNLPRSAMDEEDRAELQRLKKVAKKERALVASVAAAAGPPHAQKTATKGDNAEANGDEGESAKKTQKKSKGKKRLGKRERLQRQKALEKSRTAAAEKKVAST